MQADKDTSAGSEKTSDDAKSRTDNRTDNKDNGSSARPRSGFNKDKDGGGSGGSSEGKFAGGGEQSSWFGDIAPPDLTVIDYKDVALLSRFTSNHGKIMPGRLGDISHKDQRKISKAIKRARQVALIPYSSR